ncbi:hypothetical protein M413DRAFT_26736 [Hebeloma cylindrosporum]|uniref:Uncharacterized protein n=1 Tax=Hebeloma cylindrosporum TaxID=76867 RepID=A0A0C3C1H9_HEBCY|nr:hypothetical protein M413DRAFT_26736 [Hebeloma cylindrosporum h7]
MQGTRTRLYQNELTLLGYGTPVWEPSLVCIGDVGCFERGKFLPLFNILPNHSSPSRIIPFPQPDFPLLYVLPSDRPTTDTSTPLRAGTHALRSSSTAEGVNRAGSVLTGEAPLSFNREEGAALILPYHAFREDTLYDNWFREHMLSRYKDWHNFASRACQRNIKPCDLVLVTGCDLTSHWATATYVKRDQGIDASLGADVAPVANATFSLTGGWTASPEIDTRQGPSPFQNYEGRGSQNKKREQREYTQCVFLRGISVKERPARAIPEENVAEGPLENDNIPVESTDETFITALLDYMLEESDANMVIAGDYDLAPFLREAENSQNLRAILKRMSPRVNVENGVGSLLPQHHGEFNDIEQT